MANNRVMETVKRLLMAETYLRTHEATEAHEPKTAEQDTQPPRT